ncbi:MAG: acetate kinase [Oscillospiraceae bacterium]|nr:acetate kinase [Oscillospiraceae bacterium]
MKVLVINAGSSSLKYQLFDMNGEQVLAKGLCERIGIDGHITHTPLLEGKQVFDEDVPLPDHQAAIAIVMEKLMSPESGVIADKSEIKAVGHRVVHGGEHFSASSLIDENVLQGIQDCVPLAPLHNPANITGITACQAVLGNNVPQVAVFDTAFHQTMPRHAYTYAIPYDYYEKHKIRRYGFHGTSHRYVADRAAEMLGRPLEELKLISCHMGNGSSVCAIDGGKSVDTSMGFTPLAGVPMGTRSGDIDPSIIEFLTEKEGLTVKEVLNILNKKSGVLGVSGVSSDFRDLGKAASSGNELAALALEEFYYGVSKYIGAYAVAMGGVDAIIFTAGIGENGATEREAICKNLGVIGLKLDPEKNKVRGKQVDVTAEGSKGRVLVIPTNEELVIARDTLEIVAD